MNVCKFGKCMFGLSAVVGLVVLSGCGDDDGHGGTQPSPTFAASPTPTPTPAGDEHSEVSIGSTVAGGGALKGEYDYEEPLHLHFSACLGGSGEDCTGGTAVYSEVSPGFESLEEDEPEDEHFALIDGTPVTLVIVNIDPGLSFKFGSIVVDTAGESLDLGEAPFHADIEAQVVVEDGAAPEETWTITFELTTSDTHYERSEEYTLTYRLEEG